MAEVLSREEIDALQSALRSGQVADAPAGTTGRVRQYDFRVPDKFSKDQLRALAHLHDAMCRTLTTTLSAYLRAPIQMSPPGVEQTTYQQFIRRLPEPAVLGVVTVEPLGSAMLQLDSDLAFPVIDRLLGGPGQGSYLARALTDIEAIVIRRVMHTVLEHWREAWRSAVDLRPRLDTVEANPLFIQLAAPNDIVLIVAVDTELGTHRGSLRLCLPYSTLEPVLGRLRARQWYGHVQRERPADRARLAASLAEAPVPVSVELGRVQIPLRDLLELATGDTITLDVGSREPLTMFVNGRPTYLVTPGTLGRRLAVRVSGRVPAAARDPALDARHPFHDHAS